ncbi:MAG: hypothetical protein EB833_00210 [Thaumarchaeota archaeon S13]|nr:MAG: hypothetical protein EB832_05395 [Thaumarchaeota archaeon S14]RNJ74730.1 MAG: hypothetical protein EB833_00210 [Thaumarchaeota archaeon S13]
MMSWGAFRNPNPLCFALAIAFLLIAASHVYEWRADELSYRLYLPYLELEGTLHDIEPRALPMLDVGTSSWVVAIAFIIVTLATAAFCGRLRLLP